MASGKEQFIPLSDRIIILPLERERTTKSGIHLPDTSKEKPQEGKVIAVGAGRVADDGARIPIEVAIGDRVIYSQYAGAEYKKGNHTYIILRDKDVLAKIA